MRAGKTISVASKTGDVLVFIEYLIHGWLGSGISRYQICANFRANPKTERHTHTNQAILRYEHMGGATDTESATSDPPDDTKAPRVGIQGARFLTCTLPHHPLSDAEWGARHQATTPTETMHEPGTI